MNLTKHILPFLRCSRGVAYVEFALVAPILILMFVGSIELTRYMLILQKLEKTVSTMTDVVAQTDPRTSQLTTTTMQQLMSAVTDMMVPYSTGSTDPNIIVIITDVLAVPDSPSTNPPIPTVKWQYCGGGGATLTSLGITSKITPGVKGSTAIGSTANMSGSSSPYGTTGFAMTNNEEVLIGEVYYNYQPIMTNQVIGAKQIYRYATFMPRLGALTSFSSNCP